ncbi:TPA: hypothetical protein DDW35_02705 [Candidatus Sumerlaeota bacterium]|jgi:hypothetical protein|nr:hypothetical protein [Candidatus Sumerlaeota bacterium]
MQIRLFSFSLPFLLLLLFIVLGTGCSELPELDPLARFHETSDEKMVEQGFDLCDLTSASLQITRDLLTAPALVAAKNPATILIDAEHVQWEAGATGSKTKASKRLCVQLNAAANGKIYFISRQYVRMCEEQKRLGNGEPPTATDNAGEHVAFRLSGRVGMLKTAEHPAAYHLELELVDLKTGANTWAGKYEVYHASNANSSVHP